MCIKSNFHDNKEECSSDDYAPSSGMSRHGDNQQNDNMILSIMQTNIMSSKKQPQGNIMQLDHKDTPTSPSAFTRTTMFLSSFGSYNISSSNNNSSSSMMNQSHRHHHQDPLIVLGFNLSHFSPKIQFYICASGVFSFTIIYGYLQELLSVNILGRKHALFLSLSQLAGYAFWSHILKCVGRYRRKKIMKQQQKEEEVEEKKLLDDVIDLDENKDHIEVDCNYEFEKKGDWKDEIICNNTNDEEACKHPKNYSKSITMSELDEDHDDIKYKKHDVPPLKVYIALSFVRALDVVLTNGAMMFLNYPAKTLIKSSRVAFTMIAGLILGKKKYKMMDYVMVAMLVFGLSIFLYADHKAKAVFHPVGVLMLILSLCCDGFFNNYSELIMKKYHISQDQYQSSIYTVAFVLLLIGTVAKGQLIPGFQAMFLQDGTVDDIENDNIELSYYYGDHPTYTKNVKFFVYFLFTFTGLFGSSCAGAITKSWGALPMSVTSTVRKAGTLFLSMAAPGFHNKCTFEHIIGMFIFISAMFVKSFQKSHVDKAVARLVGSKTGNDVELDPLSSTLRYEDKNKDDAVQFKPNDIGV